MASQAANQALREIRTLFASGAVGPLTDSQLLERFLHGEGPDREDAFSALVQRYGPMVLGVCRRMLADSADAEDAFQSVFLVLARKAGAVQRSSALKPWLYGVAIRTAKEARARSARRRSREGGMIDDSRAVSPPDQGRDDLLALLDEEIARLPARYRDPIMLCELEGVSRRDAARRLGLPEGTVSSRLARARALLRQRLTRRGVALGTGGLLGSSIADAAGVALPASLVRNTARHALGFAAGGAAAGTVPVAVGSLAKGVLAMLFLSRLKLGVIATVTLGLAACLTAGMARAIGPKPDGPPRDAKAPTAVAPPKEIASDPKPGPQPNQVRGVVLDEKGRPVAGAEVRADAFTRHEAIGITAADGSFAIPIKRPNVDGTVLRARSAAGDRLGVFQFDYNLDRTAAQAPARIVLKPTREVNVRVHDAGEAPLPGATVEVLGGLRIFDEARTGPDGSARLRVPLDAKVEWILALKPGQGFDFAEFGPINEGRHQPNGGAPAAELPESLALTLDKARTVRIKAVDVDGKPLAGIEFYPWLLSKEGRKTWVNGAGRITHAATGPDGIVTFDWLPTSNESLTFWPIDDRYAHRRVPVDQDQAGLVTARLTRTVAIRGRVVRPDGTPAEGIRVRAVGSGKGHDTGQSWTRTVADGSFELKVHAEEGYAVYVEDEDWAAPARLDVIVRPGKPVAGIDFKLGRGTIIRGTITVGPRNRPAPDQYVHLRQDGGPAPEEFREKGDHFEHHIHRGVGARTDADGHYSIRVGPGTYTLTGPPRTSSETITIKDQAEIVRDFRMPRPEKGTLMGRVIRAGSDNEGIAGAKVEIVAANNHAIPFTVTADTEGFFQADCDLDHRVICATSPDGKLGAIVEADIDDPLVILALAPTAEARGLLLDEAGKPAAEQKLECGRRVFLNEERTVSMTCFAPKVVTDAKGRFVLPSLVIGQKYEIAILRENRYLAAGAVQPEKAESIDLGTLQAGAYRPPADPEDLSSFRKDAPDAGAIAPTFEASTLDGKPLKLDDFLGKYVLLDFWATWCGPCIDEVPQLQAVHDAFGKDPRFAILSLSVDETIAEPRAFQEKRKLPWAQGFLGGGVHGPTPGKFGVRAIPAFVLIGPDGKLVARGMRGEDIKREVAKALLKTP